jgi:F420-non-reducing hydrogenase large subunit
VTKANLIVGTTNNYAPTQMSMHKAVSSLIKEGKVTEWLLNMVEMAFRAYDSCFGCATHSLPGQMSLQVTIRNSAGETVNLIEQYC